jgi:CheY-like chemotaxis protein
MGSIVYTTDLGEEGVDLGKLYDYDIILLDLNLPDMSGLRGAAPLRNVAKINTPILILSGMAGIEDKVKRLRLRCRRLHDQAVPQGRAGRPHPRHCPPLQGPCAVGHRYRRTGCRSTWTPRPWRSAASACT